jgi:hypothetical protein
LFGNIINIEGSIRVTFMPHDVVGYFYNNFCNLVLNWGSHS